MFQSLTIAGRLGQDPVLRTSKNGNPWATFSVAVDDRNGQPTWYNVKAFNGTAQACADHLGKGDFVLVEGRPQIDAYRTRAGKDRVDLAVLGNTVRFGPRAQRQAEPTESYETAHAPAEPENFVPPQADPFGESLAVDEV